jgi:tetratricopeptide (TPR) repeat protein
LITAAGLTACSSVPPLDSDRFDGHPARVELVEVPWYPDDPYQCGPQSLAMVLTASGVETAPETLVPAIYVPDRRGSFAPELKASARAHGRLPYRVAPTLDALMSALDDGYPVLILQNLGLGFAPTWHFAVVIGYDRAGDNFLLRSGPHERLAMDATRFERRWRLGDYWGIVLLGPADLPGWVEPRAYEAQLAYLEAAWAPDMEAIYRRMAQRWPESTTANLGLGNLAFSRADLAGAERYYRRVLATDGDHIGALNNLAEVYARRGQLEAAFTLACRALRLAKGRPLEPAVTATLDALQQDNPGQACPDVFEP